MNVLNKSMQIIVLTSLFFTSYSFSESVHISSIANWEATATKNSFKKEKIDITFFSPISFSSTDISNGYITGKSNHQFIFPSQEDISGHKMKINVLDHAIYNEAGNEVSNIDVYVAGKLVTTQTNLDTPEQLKSLEFKLKDTDIQKADSKPNGRIQLGLIAYWEGNISQKN